VPLKVFVGDVKCCQAGEHYKCAAAEARERVDDLFELMTEESAHQNETASMQH